MLFNSYEFIFFFLPATLIVFFGLGRMTNPRYAVLWLVAASLFFYGWWDPRYLLLIISSIVFNYAVGMRLSRLHLAGSPMRSLLLCLGVTANVLVLIYFKYTNFLVANVEALTGFDFAM